jgi:hypothetical protein
MEYSNVQIEQLKDLLNVLDGKKQCTDGYRGHPRIFTKDELARHFAGEASLGFCVSTEHLQSKMVVCRFAGIDIDRDFNKRLEVFRRVLTELNLEPHSFLTAGSSPDRGKVIIALQEGIERYRVAEFLRLFLEKAHKLAPAIVPGEARSGDIELFPRTDATKRRQSQVLRIGGRNALKNGPVEMLKDLAGNPLEIKQIVKCSGNKLRAKVRKLRGPLKMPHAPWLRKSLAHGLTWSDFPRGTMSVRTYLTRLSYYCRKRYPTETAHKKYLETLEKLISKSLDLGNPSPQHGDTRNPLVRELNEQGAWMASEGRLPWQQIPAPVATKAAIRVYHALQQIAACRGLREHCFGVDQQTIADVLGVHKSAAQKAITKAAKSDLLLVLHNGSKHQRGTPGLPAMYGLIGMGETVEKVWKDALNDDLLKHRYSRCPVLGIDDPVHLAFLPTPRFWSSVRELSAASKENKVLPLLPKEARGRVGKNERKAGAPIAIAA